MIIVNDRGLCDKIMLYDVTRNSIVLIIVIVNIEIYIEIIIIIIIIVVVVVVRPFVNHRIVYCNTVLLMVS